MRLAAPFLAAALAALLPAVAGAEGATLYVKRVVVAAAGEVPLSAIVRAAGPLPAGAQEGLARTATVLADRVQFLPSSLFQPQLDAVFGSDAIVVGSWSLLVPRGTSAEQEPWLMGRLADFLVSRGLVGEDRVEMTVTMDRLEGPAPEDGVPVFQVIPTRGGTEVTFRVRSASGDSASGRAVLTADPSRAGSMVRANTMVRVVFRKGPITVEMSGRTLASAGVGESVSVYVPDSRRNFRGRLLDGKAVQVELP